MDESNNSALYCEIVEKLQHIENSDIDKNTLGDILKILREVCFADEETSSDFKGNQTFMKFVATTDCGKMLAKCLKIELSETIYKPQVFKSKVLQKFSMTDEPESNLKLLKIARCLINPVPELTFMHLNQEIVPREKAKRGKLIRPAEKIITKSKLATKSEDENTNINNTVHTLHKILKSVYKKTNEPLDYMQFVVDTSSFKNTIDNIFYTSFLCKEYKAKLLKDEVNTLKIMPVQNSDNVESDLNGKHIVSITMQEWENVTFKTGYIQNFANRAT